MRILACLMAVMLFFSSTTWAAGPAFVGTLRTNGNVLANSSPMPDGGTVRSGDAVKTEPRSLGLITSPVYGRLEVRPDSEARLASDRVRLERGAVASSQLPVEVDKYTISPQNGAPAWFAVANRDGRLVVAAYQGNVIIAAAGGPPVVVSQGSVAQQDQDQNPQPDQDQAKPKDQHKRRRRAGAAASGGWTIGSLSHAASVALVVGVGAAAAATAAGLSVTLNDQNPSSSR